MLASSPDAAGASADPVNMAELLDINDLDREIWREELDSFVPRRVFDLHTHLTRSEFELSKENRYDNKPDKSVLYKAGTVEMLDACDELLYPGRTVTRLLFPVPHRECDFTGSNNYIAAQARKKPGAAALMLVHPKMTSKEVDQAIRRHRFLGYKPYRTYSVTGDAKNCRIPDFLPEHLLPVANIYGLIMGLHISEPMGIADKNNLDDLERLTHKYPRIRWALFHCARSYSFWGVERAAARLRNIPNLWFETSSVCETDAFDALFSNVNSSRVCYGSDDLAVGVTRGKYIAFGYSWAEMNRYNQKFNLSHAEGRMTFVRYEMLRAMKRAAQHARYTKQQIEDLFYNNGARLVAAASKDLNQVLGPEKAG